MYLDRMSIFYGTDVGNVESLCVDPWVSDGTPEIIPLSRCNSKADHILSGRPGLLLSALLNTSGSGFCITDLLCSASQGRLVFGCASGNRSKYSLNLPQSSYMNRTPWVLPTNVSGVSSELSQQQRFVSDVNLSGLLETITGVLLTPLVPFRLEPRG